jgi:CHAT domain-containing protein/Tfp pilus assembly protein PilF
LNTGALAGDIRSERLSGWCRTVMAFGLARLLLLVWIGLSSVCASADPVGDAATLQESAATAFQEGRTADVEPLLKRSIEVLERELGPNDPKLIESLNHLADLYELQHRYTDAEPIYKRMIATREKAPGRDNLDLGASVNALGGLYQLEGRYNEAEALFRRALEIAEAASNPPADTTATILNNLGLIYQNQGRYAEAEPLYRRAIELVGKAPQTDQLLGPVIRNNLAGLVKEQRRYDEAEKLYRAVLTAREKGAAPLELAASLNNLASVYDAQGRFDDAEPLFQRALEVREKAVGPDHPDVAQSLNNLAGIYWARREFAKAEPLLERALDISENTLPPDHPETAAALNNLAALYASEGEIDKAVATSARAVAAIEAHLAARAGQSTDAAFSEYRKSRTYFSNYIGIAYRLMTDQPERRVAIAADTLRVAQLAENSNTAHAVSAMAARIAATNDVLAAAIRERQDLTAAWQHLDTAMVKIAAQPQHDAKQETALREKLANTRQAIDALDRKLVEEFPDYTELANPKPMAAQAVQALLAPDQVLLVYFVTRRETWFWAVRDDSVGLYRVEVGGHDLASEVRALRSIINPDLDPYPASQAYALYKKIVAPALPQIRDAKHLIVVPDGALQSLPFGMLVTEKPAKDPTRVEDHRDIAWLVRDYAVSVLPAVSSLRALHQTGLPRVADKPFLGIGNPVLAGDPGSERGAATRPFREGVGTDVRDLPALPETADELRAIANTLGASDHDLLLGERASESELRQTQLDNYRVIEFATHGVLPGQLNGLTEPALVLTPPPNPTPEDDGLLTASKIANLKLNADWIVLSACNTATDDENPDAAGWSGLTKAFFYAGARSLLISQWPVWSKATVALTTSAVAELVKDPKIGRAEALRRAEMAMLDSKNPPEFAHPLAWAPFILAGEGGAGR